MTNSRALETIVVDGGFYLSQYPHVSETGMSPQEHYDRYGRRLGYLPFADAISSAASDASQLVSPPLPIESGQQNIVGQSDFDAVVREMDLAWYASLFPKGSAPHDPVTHYLTQGCHQGLEPAPWFSTPFYLATYEDARTSGLNAFVHYVLIGKTENRPLGLPSREPSKNAVNVYLAHGRSCARGSAYEDFDPLIGAGKEPRVKALAYYLPQYHPFAQNDEFWGKGFTEWRNIMRGLPRFEGHLQPKIPRDLGFYTLDEGQTMRRQFELARQAGIHGFCFYHYWFDGQRVMETPVERLLADKTLEIPFSIMWANENWSRTWDGDDAQILLKQSYNHQDEIAFIDDLARHFKDERYIRMNGRPVFYIYRASQIPDTKGTIARWRELLIKRHDVNPYLFMALTFDDADPRDYGFDGAIEFPPHHILIQACEITQDVRLMDPNFSGKIFDYEKIVKSSTSASAPAFPLIRSILPNWDNDARRPGRGTIIANSSPSIFGAWARWAVDQAVASPTYGDSFICINAWNEWAEGAYLEPDTHYGSAYLNELARALHLA
jgi:hypothetical protein